MNVPRWIQHYWMEKLWPALSQSDLSEGQLKALLAQMLQDWQQHATTKHRPISDPTVGRYLTETRNWIRDLPLLELCPPGCRKFSTEEVQQILAHFNQPTEWWAALTDLARERVDARNKHQILLPDPDGIVRRIEELLQQQDWAPLAVGLAGAVGRRIGEVLYSGMLEPKTDYSVWFKGRLKRPGDEEEQPFEIPTLCKAQLVLDAWERLRTHPDLRAMNLPFEEQAHRNQVLRMINQRLAPTVRKAADYYFQDLVPTQAEDDAEKEFHTWGLYVHLFRSIFRTIAIWYYCPVQVDPDTFGATILGHTFYNKLRTKQEKLNFASEHFYRRYAISDGRGNVDGRRGIHLHLPGVAVLDAFKEKTTMSASAPEEAPASQKRRKKRAEQETGPRETKTGFSSIRPRVKTRDWFDQVAREQQIAWKDTDDTLVLLLTTYEQHKLCGDNGAAAWTPERLTPQQLGLSPELAAQVQEAMRISGKSFWEYLLMALDRQSRTRINLAGKLAERQKKAPDFSQTPTSHLLKTRRPEEAVERLRRAIATIIQYNRGCSDPNARWFITQTLLRQFTGAHPDYIKPVLKANEALLEKHHAHFAITSAHNRVPAPKPKPIQESGLQIPENPADIPVLSDIRLPQGEPASTEAPQEGEPGATEAPTQNPA